MREGKTPQLRSGQRGPKGIKQIPIKYGKLNLRKQLVKLVDKMCISEDEEERLTICEKIDQIVYEIYSVDNDAIQEIESELFSDKFYRFVSNDDAA